MMTTGGVARARPPRPSPSRPLTRAVGSAKLGRSHTELIARHCTRRRRTKSTSWTAWWIPTQPVQVLKMTRLARPRLVDHLVPDP